MTYALDFDQHLPVSAQIGMQQAIDHADPRWIEAAKSCVFGEARCHQEITVDDVWLALERVNEQRKAIGTTPVRHAQRERNGADYEAMRGD